MQSINTQAAKTGKKAKFRAIGFGANFLVVAVATLLMLGVSELFVRTFVTVRNIGPVFTTYDPIYGKRLKANLHATRAAPEFHFEINTNSLGMRDPEPAKFPRDGIVFVGDSFTMGYGVEDREAFPAVIRGKLESRGIALPVVNTGMGDNGNGRWVKFFEHDAARFHPRLVVFQVMANDFDDNLREGLFKLDTNGALRELPVGPPGLARQLQSVIDDVPGLAYSHLVGLGWMTAEALGRRNGLSSISAEDSGDERPTDALTYALIGAAVDKARADGAKVVGLLVGLSGQRREKTAEIFAQRRLICIDGPNKKDAPDMFFKVDGHWNASGQRRAAELLMPVILGAVGRNEGLAE